MLLDKEFLEVAAENGKLRARIAELEAALKPFDQYDNTSCYLMNGFVDVKVKLRDLRAARADVEKKE